MPAKKGGGGNNGIFGLLYLPVAVVVNMVFTPAHWAMWIIVDKLGDDMGGGWTYIAKRCLENQQFKAAVQYTKEFRYVLYDYFRWTRISSPLWRCKACSKPGKVWCVDCGKKFCPTCAANLHASGSINMIHSLEEIRQPSKQEGVLFLSPILPEVLIALMFFYGFFTIDFFGKDYLTTQTTCPMVQTVQSAIASVDTSFYYHVKGSFFYWCNTEDSYLRFILDAWVRSIVTHSDNTLLVFQTLPQAFLFDIVLMSCLVPVVAFVYAVIENVVHYVENRVPRTGIFVKLEETVQFFSIASYFGMGDIIPIPDTYERARAPMDFADAFFYRLDRKMRNFKFIYKNALTGLQSFAWHLITYTMTFRLGCIWFGLGRPLRYILSWVGFGSTIAAHEADYKAVHHMLISENILWNLFKKSLASANIFLNIVPSSMYQASAVWLLLSAVVVAGCIWISNKILMERRQFFGAKAPKVGLALLLANIAEKEKVQ